MVLFQFHICRNYRKVQQLVLRELSVHNRDVAQKFVQNQDALKVPGVHLGAALRMVEADGARDRVARGVLRGKPSSVKLMEEVGAAIISDAQRVPRVVPTSA